MWSHFVHQLFLTSELDNLTLGGPYGEKAPVDLENVMQSSTGHRSEIERFECGTMNNNLSPLASAEMTRRLVMHDIVDDQFKWPGLTEIDQKQILYGSEDTLFFGDQKWGGMSSDPGIYLQSNGINKRTKDNLFWKVRKPIKSQRSIWDKLKMILMVVGEYSPS